MLLFSPPRCDALLNHGSAKQTGSMFRRFSVPLWPSTPTASIPLSPRAPKQKTVRPSPPPRKGHQMPKEKSTTDMSHQPGTPRSSAFSPTLGSIPEVFEYEALDAKFGPVSLNDAPETPDVFLPEASSMCPPTLTRASSWPAIIQSPSRRVASPFAVSKALRSILEADRARRRRIMKAYLKAIVFLKYLWRANERYGNVMVTTGMYMQR
ncbi:hypothetical protein CC77DRAFT_979961 [Alternaria alternata]|uniref:Uncharacterized protein n=1 Tax=Alternaria alternata TaxID=5599 RepID=A0A177DZP9_ALTAL|nr:hypothetical protein CC77DRAFT_979961 [Alternaria alternata]OAG24968.1 hypothetical protein CC77DRAFT_979961 [Alternaria alternata]RYN53598.1 hypothetical protein AA0118_g9600 [Alternaria tenuissima]